MSESALIAVAAVAGIIIFTQLYKFIKQVPFALVGGALSAILIYFVLPTIVPVVGPAQKAAQKAQKKKNKPKFKSIKELRKDLGASEKALQDRINDIGKSTR